MKRGETLRIFLPLRPAALPDAQRLRAWALRSGVQVQMECVDLLPKMAGPSQNQSLAIGAFANGNIGSGRHNYSLIPAGDWQALQDWAQVVLPSCTLPFTQFTDRSASPEILPGEFWDEMPSADSFDLAMAPPEWALLQQSQRAGAPRLAFGESCTGGGLAARITALPGSSALLQQGLVTYSNVAKQHLLGVQDRTLDRYGAVSEETALEMLAGTLREADMAAAITGIAGPGGATPGKPVGTVCIAWGQRAAEAQVRTCHFEGDRWSVQYAAGSVALGGLLSLLRS